MDDKELIESVLRGNTNDFGILVERYSVKIYRLCLSLCGNSADAEDATQEAFIDSFRYLASLAEKEKFYPWLCMIARRKSYRQIRSRTSFADIDEMEEFLSADRAFTDNTFREERSERVRKAISKMSEKRRQVCEMFYFRNMKISEISKKLSLSEATVKSRLYDAREYLRKELCDMNTEKENIDLLEERIKKQLRTLWSYNSLHGDYDENYNSKINEAIKLIEKIDDENTKQYYMSGILTYQSFAEKDEDKKKEILEKRDKAEEADSAYKTVNELINRYFNINDEAECIKFIDETALVKIKEYKGKPGYGYAKGSLLFWRGRSLFEQKEFDEAKENFAEAARLLDKSEVYRANAVAAIREIDEMTEKAYDPASGYEEAIAEGLLFENNRLFFYSQPGFSSGGIVAGVNLEFNSLLFYASRCNRIIFDLNMKPGEVIKSADGKSTLECISYSESVSVIAGSFENCMHTRTDTELSWRGRYTYDMWYAPGVGLVKAVSNCMGRTENYELAEYSVKGAGYAPFEVGNRWVFRNPDVPSYVYHDITYTLEYTDGSLTNFAVTSPVTFVKDFEKCEDIDSYVYLSFADKLCNDWKLTEAIEMLKKSVRLNINEEAVRISLYGIEVLSRFEEYRKKGYRFCPSSISASYVQTNESSVSFRENTFSFGPYRWGARGAYEDRIFGIKPFRYLSDLTGSVWNEKWVPGYREESSVEDGLKLIVAAEDGGSVTVPAGTFENCRKVTLRIDKPEGKTDKWYFEDNYSHMDAGVKEYWFAPGVGIVKIASTWGTTCYAEALLKSYNVPASKETEYLPIQIGNRWEYEEPHLVDEGYRANAILSIASGMNGKYLMTSSQEFICFKTEEEYNEFVKVSHLY